MAGIDLDGTLLTNEKKITSVSENMLIKAAESGICIVPVTGRPLYGMPDAVMHIQSGGRPVVRYAITSNGACTYETEGKMPEGNHVSSEMYENNPAGERGRNPMKALEKNNSEEKPGENPAKTSGRNPTAVEEPEGALKEGYVADFAWKELRTTLMEVADARKVLKAAEGVTAICEVFTEGYGYHEPSQEEPLRRRFESTPVMDYIRQSRRCVDSLELFLDHIQKKQGGIENISFMFDSREDRDIVRRRLEPVRGIHVIVPKNTDLEIVSERTDKGSALLDLAARLGIRPEEILAIGDNDNDIGLPGKVGVFIAMGNAPEEIRRKADYVTLDNMHDGAAAALEKFCMQEQKG